MITVGGLALAGTLVILGARLAAVPAPTPDLSQPGTPDNPRPVTVLMRDYVFNPTPLYLVAGETVELDVFNAGMVAHQLVLGGAVVQEAWRSADAAATPAGPLASPPAPSVAAAVGGVEVFLQPGESRKVRYTVPVTAQPSDPLQLVCQLPGHVERGMVGSVILASR